MPTLDKYRLQGISFIGGGVVPEDNPYLELIEEITVFGSAVTSVQFSGFTATKEDTLVLVANIIAGASATYWLIYNNNTTVTDYWNQRLAANGTSVTGIRINSQAFTHNYSAGKEGIHIVDIKITNDGYCTAQSEGVRRLGDSDMGMYDYFQSSIFTVDSITQLDVTGANSNGIAVGSRFQLYKIIN